VYKAHPQELIKDMPGATPKLTTSASDQLLAHGRRGLEEPGYQPSGNPQAASL